MSEMQVKCIYCDNNCESDLCILSLNINTLNCLHCRCNHYHDLINNIILGTTFYRYPFRVNISWKLKITTIYKESGDAFINVEELKAFNYILDITPQNIEYKLKTILNLL